MDTSFDPATATPAEMAAYAAGYLDALHDTAGNTTRAEQVSHDLAVQLENAHADIDYWYRIANPPRLPTDTTPYAARAARRARAERAAAAAAREDATAWTDTPTRSIPR